MTKNKMKAYLFYPSPPPPMHLVYYLHACAASHLLAEPLQGAGSQEAANFTTKWAFLDGEAYPGAGTGTLTPDGRVDPLIAFTYDSVFALAMAIGSVQETANNWGGELNGFVGERCVVFWDT